MTYTSVNLDTWNRKDHYNFFKDFDEPFFGVTFNVKVSEGFIWCKEQNRSFFIYYLYAALRAVNEVEAFRYRILDGKPVLFEKVSISPTIKRADGTFGFSYMEFKESFDAFCNYATKEIERVQNDDELKPSGENVGTVHFSALPWLHFTSLSHARNYRDNDSVPKISVGKVVRANEEWIMPVSVHVNHALADGMHVGHFAEVFEAHLNKEY